jgi:hypothetical protein
MDLELHRRIPAKTGDLPRRRPSAPAQATDYTGRPGKSNRSARHTFSYIGTLPQWA